MIPIRKVEAWEVMDSRGNPTVRAAVTTDRARGVFTVPSGASTGAHEALELRDGGSRLGGKGVRKAIGNIENVLGPLVTGMDVTDQEGIDSSMVERDGSHDLSNMGANAILGVSGAAACSAALSLEMPLYMYLSGGRPGRIPMSLFQVLNAGAHAEGGIEVQDFTILPCRAKSLMEAYEIAWSVYDQLSAIVVERGNQPVIGDEGGLSPPMVDIDEAFGLVLEGIERAGHRNSSNDVAMGLDVAASHFWDAGTGNYVLASEDEELDTGEWIDLVAEWVKDYHILSLEDPMAEDDWEGWRELTSRVGTSCQIIGDDLLVTSMQRLERAIEGRYANAILVKPNQAGTLTAAIRATRRAKEAGFGTVISARSGETCDTTIADLAVGIDAGQIKLGSHIGSGRTSKYNRLFEIEREYEAKYAGIEALSFSSG